MGVLNWWILAIGAWFRQESTQRCWGWRDNFVPYVTTRRLWVKVSINFKWRQTYFQTISSTARCANTHVSCPCIFTRRCQCADWLSRHVGQSSATDITFISSKMTLYKSSLDAYRLTKLFFPHLIHSRIESISNWNLTLIPTLLLTKLNELAELEKLADKTLIPHAKLMLMMWMSLVFSDLTIR